MDYNYKAGKERIEEILDNDIEIDDKDCIPSEDNFTFSNAYRCWDTAIFVDIRKSTELFSKENKKIVAKIVRSFTSEIIEILRNDDVIGQPKEIGIRGDCVYAIYSTPKEHHDYEIYIRACCINTLIKMLNKLLNKRGYNSIDVGIGISTDRELIIKAGRKNSGVNAKVWIGDSVTKASKLSSLGNKNNIRRIVISKSVYNHIIDKECKNCGEKAKSWFEKVVDTKLGTYYHCNIIRIDFNNWITEGMSV